MTGEQLRAVVADRKAKGHKFEFFTVPRGNRRLNGPWPRVRVMRGVTGRVVGEPEPHLLVVEVSIDDLERALDRAGVPKGSAP